MAVKVTPILDAGGKANFENIDCYHHLHNSSFIACITLTSHDDQRATHHAARVRVLEHARVCATVRRRLGGTCTFLYCSFCSTRVLSTNAVTCEREAHFLRTHTREPKVRPARFPVNDISVASFIPARIPCERCGACVSSTVVLHKK